MLKENDKLTHFELGNDYYKNYNVINFINM